MKKNRTFRRLQEQREEEWLSPRAALAGKSRGRLRPEALCPYRTCFQRDRDRILYSKAFRRLIHKTQVFIAPEGDHYRTRLTHTLEVSQLARAVSSGLRLNLDLTEAVALGHDLGHSPFGHAGESELDRCLKEFAPLDRFLHQEQSLRVVDLLERPGGLNLTLETREGIQYHSKGRSSLAENGFNQEEDQTADTLEAEVVRVSDRLAYINHDTDDALRAGIIKEKSLPLKASKILGRTTSERINRMITDIIRSSLKAPKLRMSREIASACDELKEFLWEKVYQGSAAKREEGKCKKVISFLFHYFIQHPREVPELFFSASPESGDSAQRARAVCDYIAGMTDRYALILFDKLFVPKVWQHF